MDSYTLNCLIKDKNNIKINAEADISVSLLKLALREFILTSFKIYAINNIIINMMLNLSFNISKEKLQNIIKAPKDD